MPNYKHEYRFEVYSRRWGHKDCYRIKLTKDGWDVSHIAISGPCDKEGNPTLFKNLRHDSINYPSGLGNYMEHIWEKAQSEFTETAEIQRMLDVLAEWVSLTEENTPTQEIYGE